MPNRLITEQSQYLLQHANNPVDWYPWGDEAFAKAKSEHKPVIVSIGYAACHWCHVMEHESFENDEVAAYMNEHFVCIKVDREEHPDVDHMYMDAVQAISGNGGWPLNAFVTPERVPFYGGTYYPPRPAYNKPSWMQLMQRMVQIWEHQHDEVKLQTEQMVLHLQQSAKNIAAKAKGDWTKETNQKIAENLLKQADKEKGGFGNAPKFPGTMAISFLLENYHFSGNEDALKQALRSLDAMADGGIYDQLGGGFARYATDRDWLAPHFEKMLYDNALLILSYCDAFAVTGSARYKTIVEETIDFVERELKDITGGYYCALDADSEGVEGKFYTWTWQQWVEDLGDDAAIAADYFGITEHGNWEETNILHIPGNAADVAKRNNVSVDELMLKIQQVKKKLLNVRSGRIRPLTDDKCLLSWNALMNIALSKAGATLCNEHYKQRAAEHMQWMLKQFDQKDGLKHTWKQGIAKIPAKLDDYAYLIQAMLQLASVSGENSWVRKAAEMITLVIRDFGHDEDFFYYTPAGQTDIPVRKVDLYDGATPSANALMAHNLWICGMCMEQTSWIERANSMLHKMADSALRYGYSFGYWGQLIQRSIVGMRTMVFVDARWKNEADAFHVSYTPNVFPLFYDGKNTELPIFENKFCEGNLHIFVCSEDACLSPVSSVEQALSVLNDFK